MNYAKITVPATTANCGPAFDAVGMACTLYNDFELHLEPAGSDKLKVKIIGEGAAHLNRGTNNIVVQAILRVAAAAGFPHPDIDIRMENRIPLARGLGSSAAAIVGGAVCANLALGQPLSTDDIFNIASDMEGHPDNVAPALFGGITVSILDDGKAKSLRFLPLKSLKLIVAIPEFKLATKTARQVLPQKVDFHDAVFNVSRAALLVAALATGDYGVLPEAFGDKLHQQYRQPLIKGMPDVLAAARQAGALGAVISGAGPCLIAFAEDIGNEVENIGKAMITAFKANNVKARYIVLDIDAQGARSIS